MIDENDQISKPLSNQHFQIIVDGITEYVDAKLMMEVSGLFTRRYIDLQKQKNKNHSIDFSDIKYRGKLISKFLKICQGQSADIKVSDVYYLLLIAEEWECPEISQQLSLFLKLKVEPQELLSRFIFYIYSQQDISSIFIDIVASKFRYIFQSSEFKNLPPKYICLIINNPNCEKPRRDLLENFIIETIKKHGICCVSLIKHIDLLNTDIKNITDLNGELLRLNLSPMYPNVSRILQLRRCEIDFIQLQGQNDDLKNENDNLKKQIQLLKRIDDNQMNE